MPTQRVLRINELAKKQREEGLTAEEKEEQARLRQEYLAAFRKNAMAELESVVIQNPDGSRHKLQKKN